MSPRRVAIDVALRDVSPMVQKFKNFLGGRTHNNPLRFQKGVAERPGPEANLPEGPSHKLSGNYYFTRDGRREVGFPTLLADNSKDAQKAIEGGEGAAAVTTAAKGGKRPGQYFNYSN